MDQLVTCIHVSKVKQLCGSFCLPLGMQGQAESLTAIRSKFHEPHN